MDHRYLCDTHGANVLESRIYERGVLDNLLTDRLAFMVFTVIIDGRRVHLSGRPTYVGNG